MQDGRLPYISVLTDPTTGGVWASFASLGDFVIAEPGAYIGFAGKRLIMGALKVKLPDGFQSAEYQMENGFLDAIVKRQDMRGYLMRLTSFFRPNGNASQPPSPAAEVNHDPV
jgi:acetyl-CoA carboxylase carboxyl transferase subunit beta